MSQHGVLVLLGLVVACAPDREVGRVEPRPSAEQRQEVPIGTARALDHRAHAVAVLAMAALLAVAAVPVVVLDPGFLLSFGATAGILLGVPLLAPAAS